MQFIRKLTDEVHELKSEISNLKDTRINEVTIMEDQYFIKEELMEIKGLIKQCKQKERFESLKRDSILVERIDKVFEDNNKGDVI